MEPIVKPTRNMHRIATGTGRPTFFISRPPTQEVRQTIRPREISNAPVSMMIAWPRATIPTVETCSRMFFQFAQVRKYC